MPQTNMNSTLDRSLTHCCRLLPALLAAISLSFLGATGFGAEVAENWAKHCASCHGNDGKGQTKADRMAGVKDQTDAQYQATLKDEKTFTSIKEGLKEGEKEKMKPFKDKLSDDEIKALIARVRAFKK
jgi:cytochrome c6